VGWSLQPTRAIAIRTAERKDEGRGCICTTDSGGRID
jgi:hypothetical protein